MAASIKLEVFGLAWLVGEVCLDRGYTSAWDLAKEVHSKFPPLPHGTVWKLAVNSSPVSSKAMHVSGASAINLVKYVPTPFDKIKAVSTLGKLLLRVCSIDDLSLEDHLIWLSLQSLILGDDFNQGMDNVTLSSGLQSLTFGDGFNQSMHNVTLPSGLQSLTFGVAFNQSMDNVALPNDLQSLTFGDDFSQSMHHLALPSSLQGLTFGDGFNRSMHNVILPSGLQSFTFGGGFNQSMHNVTLPSGLQSLTFGIDFIQRMDNVALPSGLQSLTFGRESIRSCKSGVEERSGPLCTYSLSNSL